jgi:hypothetical protein
MELIFRQMIEDDRPFIDNSWASSFYSSCRIKDFVSPNTFHSFHRPVRDRFLAKPTARIVVCECDGLILGWAAAEDIENCTLLHYVYVKSMYRKEYGIASQLVSRLVPSGNVIYSHNTRAASEIIKGKGLNWKWVPQMV